MAKQINVVISIGPYAGNKLVVSPEIAGKLMPLLAGCTIASEEWDGDEHYVLVESDVNIEMKTTAYTPMNRASFESIREAIKAEKEAAEAPKE